MGNLVIGVDSSTQSTKAIAWDKDGSNIAEGRCDIPLNNPSLEKFEQNVEDWWNAFCVSCNDLSKKINMDEVDALAISNQRETLAKLDSNGKEVYPATVWMEHGSRRRQHGRVRQRGALRQRGLLRQRGPVLRLQ